MPSPRSRVIDLARICRTLPWGARGIPASCSSQDQAAVRSGATCMQPPALHGRSLHSRGRRVSRKRDGSDGAERGRAHVTPTCIRIYRDLAGRRAVSSYICRSDMLHGILATFSVYEFLKYETRKFDSSKVRTFTIQNRNPILYSAHCIYTIQYMSCTVL